MLKFVRRPRKKAEKITGHTQTKITPTKIAFKMIPSVCLLMLMKVGLKLISHKKEVCKSINVLLKISRI